MRTPTRTGRCIVFLMILCVSGIAYSGAQESRDTQDIPAEDYETERDSRPWTFTPLPLAFYTSDTGIAGGALLVAERGNNSDDISPLIIQTAGTYTQKHQGELSLLFQGDFFDKKYRLQGLGGFFNSPSLFFGVGPEADSKENYEVLKSKFELMGLRTTWRRLYAGPLCQFDFVEYASYDKDGTILRYIPEQEAIRTLSLGVVLLWDSRSSMVFPRSGSYMELKASLANSAWGSDSDFHIIRADIRKYHSISDETILAAQALGTYGNGNIPLHKMAEIGGLNVLRGYPYSRYRDKSSCALQSELRFPIYGIFRGTVFAAAGQVASSPQEFRVSRMRIAGGAGLRIRPNPDSDVQIRLDVGLSPETYGIYITLMEAF